MSIITGTLGILHAQRREDLHAVDVGHREIGEHDVGAVRLEVGDARGAAVGGVHVEARVAEDGLEREAHRGFVVDDQDPARHGRTLPATASALRTGPSRGARSTRRPLRPVRPRDRRPCGP